MTELVLQLQKIIKGDVVTDEEALVESSHDASIFEVKPRVIVCPKTQDDVKALVTFVSSQKKNHPALSLTARAAGTDMSGGPLSESIIISFTKYFNHTPQIHGDTATTEPGVFYRDFEKETLKHNLIFPSYPSSREICAMGGIINNNAGGEKSLQYGKTEKYVTRMKMVLADGNAYEFVSLSENELEKKKKQKDFEGEVYRKLSKLLSDNYDEIMRAKPRVTKNSAGYFLWNVWDKEKKTFDLTKLFVGAQGTLGILLEADIALMPVHTHREMVIIALHDLSHLGEIVQAVLPFSPESFESYDDNTLKLALKYYSEFQNSLGTHGRLQTWFMFLPEFMMSVFGGLPKLVLQIDFTGDNVQELQEKVARLKEKLAPLHPKTRVAVEDEEKKYWAIRRESFNLLRKKIVDMHTAPFIDDFVVDPVHLPEFLPKLEKILKKYPSIIYTIAGHVGNGNFHIIPLMNLSKKSEHEIIPRLSQEVFELVLEYHGSLNGEHNDGIIRTPYLEKMYGKKIVNFFEHVKEIFDPENIFNPGKKVHGSLEYAMDHIREKW